MAGFVKSILCVAVFLLLVAPASDAAFGAPADPKFILDCSNTPPTVGDTQPSKSAACKTGSVTSTPTPWTGGTFTIGTDSSSAQFRTHGPG